MSRMNETPVRIALASFVLLTALAGVAYAQIAGAGAASKVEGAATVYEFTNQDVQAAAVVTTLNDLSKQGWDVFQVIPTWTIRNEGEATQLVAKSYQVFARKPVAAGK